MAKKVRSTDVETFVQSEEHIQLENEISVVENDSYLEDQIVDLLEEVVHEEEVLEQESEIKEELEKTLDELFEEERQELTQEINSLLEQVRVKQLRLKEIGGQVVTGTKTKMELCKEWIAQSEDKSRSAFFKWGRTNQVGSDAMLSTYYQKIK